jgi:hypothetical protein
VEEETMKQVRTLQKISRRTALKATGAATFGAMLIASGGTVLCPRGAWAVQAKALAPETMATLIQMARDVYPHDRIRDEYYAKAIASHDEKAAGDAGHKSMLEDGVAGLDLAAQGKGAARYVDLAWEIDRVAILRGIESSGFFQAIRGGLITGIYNNPDLWPAFGYEGESASKGGYINRGFDDIDWL